MNSYYYDGGPAGGPPLLTSGAPDPLPSGEGLPAIPREGSPLSPEEALPLAPEEALPPSPGGERTADGAKRRARRQSSHGDKVALRAAIGFVLALVLLVAAAVGCLLLNPSLPTLDFSLPQLSEVFRRWEEGSFGSGEDDFASTDGDFGYYYDDGSDFGSDFSYDFDHGFDYDFSYSAPQPVTSIPRAPTDPSVTLRLSAAPGRELSLQELYRKCIPSIVGIRAHITTGDASGTGIVMTNDGYIITNYHVIQGAHRSEVVLQDGTVYPALLVGGDQLSDLAVLKISAHDLTPAEFGDSDSLQVGDTALAIGNPLGEELQGTMTNGIISAIGRDVNVDGNTMTLIQTTAALNSGNSGGALLNAYGQVIGITNMKMMSYYDTIEGLGFAIPSVSAKAVVDELIAYGHVGGRPTLGITAYSITDELAAQQGMVPGVLIDSVIAGSGAQEAGLLPGDVITHCNGVRVTTVDEINDAKSPLQAGDSLHFTVLRGEETLEVDVVLIERYRLDD